MAGICLAQLDETAAAAGRAPAGDWAQWRGPTGDGNAEPVALDLARLAETPDPIWQRPLGRGFSGIATWRDTLYTAAVHDGREYLFAVSAPTGEDLWRSPIGEPVLAGMLGEGPRATPAVGERAVFMAGSQGDIVAFDRPTGRELWRFAISQHTDWRPAYGFSASPLLWNDLLIYPAGGESGLGIVALDQVTGELRWSAADGPSSYSTPTLGRVAGVPQLVVLTNQAIWGLAPADGRELWRFPWPEEPFDSAVSPVFLDGDRIFVSADGLGSVLLRITRQGDAFRAEKLWSNDTLSNDYATSLALGDSIYGTGSFFLFALAPDDGSPRWKSRGFHLASLTAVNSSLLLTLDYECEAALLEPGPSGARELTRLPIFPYQRCLTSPTIVGNRLFVRNEKQMAAFELD